MGQRIKKTLGGISSAMRVNLVNTCMTCIFSLLFFSCNSSTEKSKEDIFDTSRLNFTFIKGIDKRYGYTIEISSAENGKMILKSYGGGTWMGYTEFEVYKIEGTSYSIIPTSGLGIGVCKSGKWGEPYLGIGMGFDTVAFDMLKKAEIHIWNKEGTLDTLIEIKKPVSYFNMAPYSKEAEKVYVYISLEEHPNFTFDTLEFDCYKTMICAGSGMTKQDTLKLILKDSSIYLRDKSYRMLEHVTSNMQPSVKTKLE
ncbi:MAG: hypothetical protein AAGI38_05590 [Bacteroidota bacterium]